MIEERFAKWLKLEQEAGEFSMDDLRGALFDDDAIELLWADFAKWHREDLVELVREQIKAFMKKGPKHN
jgi:hypothetical protein